MKSIIITICFVGFVMFTHAQHPKDSLSLSNYSQRATVMAESLSTPLTLSSNQKDSVTSIYRDYFYQLLQVKSKSITFMDRSQAIQRERFSMDARLKKVLSPLQFKLMMQKRQSDYQDRVKRADSLYNRRH